MRKCQMCHAEGQDHRTMRINNMYDMKEASSEFERTEEGFYVMVTCKHCRGKFVQAVREWAEDCKRFRYTPKDSDGVPEEFDVERNVPMRVNGTTVMMTMEEAEEHKKNT